MPNEIIHKSDNFLMVEYNCSFCLFMVGVGVMVVLVEFCLTRGIYGRGLIRTRLGYLEESGSSSPGDNLGTHEHC